jgi:hypothetical protein
VEGEERGTGLMWRREVEGEERGTGLMWRREVEGVEKDYRREMEIVLARWIK